MTVDSWVPLANNVQKLAKGEEKNGIGRFLYEELHWTPTDSQLASHLGVIFTLSGAWIYNGKKIGIRFKRQANSWCELIKEYYFESIFVDDA